MNAAQAARGLVWMILSNAKAFDGWTIQGFGMMRLHLQPENARRQGAQLVDDMRLNIWTKTLLVPGVSVMHDHPWNFESVIVSGTLENVRYMQDPTGTTYQQAHLKPGPKGGLLGGVQTVRLRSLPPEHYGVGQTYQQRAEDIHVTRPSEGAITLNLRQRIGADVARVFWPERERWVSAEPRPATVEEVEAVAKLAMKRWQA